MAGATLGGRRALSHVRTHAVATAAVAPQVEDEWISRLVTEGSATVSTADRYVTRCSLLKRSHCWCCPFSQMLVNKPPCLVRCSLKPLVEKSLAAAATLRMPTTRNEAYRYTDVSSLVKSQVKVSELQHCKHG